MTMDVEQAAPVGTARRLLWLRSLQVFSKVSTVVLRLVPVHNGTKEPQELAL